MELQSLEQRLGHTFTKQELLVQALTHCSYANEHQGAPHNERLEFLGDAVLQYVVTKHIFHTFPEEAEGVMSAYRATLVNTSALARVARHLELEAVLLLPAKQRQDLLKSDAVLADAVESVIGALFLDGGLSIAEQCVLAHVCAQQVDTLHDEHIRDPKTRLQELVQRKHAVIPRYQVLSSEGPDHDKVFQVSVSINEREVARGTGKSKQEAEQDAAARAIAQSV